MFGDTVAGQWSADSVGNQGFPVIHLLVKLSCFLKVGQVLAELLNLALDVLGKRLAVELIQGGAGLIQAFFIGRCVDIDKLGKNVSGLLIRLLGFFLSGRTVGVATREDFIAGPAEGFPQFAIFPVTGNSHGLPFTLQGFGLIHGFLQRLMVYQCFGPLNDLLLDGFVVFPFFVQRAFKLFQQAVEALLHLPVVSEIHRPGFLPFLPGRLVNPLGGLPVDVRPVCLFQEQGQVPTNGLAFLQVGLLQVGLCFKVGLAGLVRLVRCGLEAGP